MAFPCQGFTFNWGTATLWQVSQLEVSLQRGLPLARTTTLKVVGQDTVDTGELFSANIGEVRLLTFSPLGLPLSEYGRRKTLTIRAPVPRPMTAVYGTAVTILNSDCVYQDVNATAEANDAIRFAYTFKVMDTVGAPSNP